MQAVHGVGFARPALRPTYATIVEGILQILGDETRQEPGTVRPFLNPPAAVRDRLVEQRDRRCIVVSAGAEVPEHIRPCDVERIGLHHASLASLTQVRVGGGMTWRS